MGLSQQPCPNCFWSHRLSNTVAFVLGLLLVGAIAADAFLFDATNLIFLAEKLVDLIEWLAFWR